MSEISYPPTVIVVHPKERKSKCTVAALRGQPGFTFWKYPRFDLNALEDYVRLGLDGPELSRADEESGLLILDGTWRLAEKMEPDFCAVPIRSLPSWKTAYPRVSKNFEDPEIGLATIEALYIAYKLMGRETSGLLDDYHWADDFLELNADRLEP